MHRKRIFKAVIPVLVFVFFFVSYHAAGNVFSDKEHIESLIESDYRYGRWQGRTAKLLRCPAGSDSGEKADFGFRRVERTAYQTGDAGYLSGEEGIEVELLAEDSNAILIDTDITTNQIWTANNIYIIPYTVNVQALLVIEPGTEIRCDYDGLRVNNGGTLISCGTPDKPIVYTSVYLDPPYFMYYYCAIYVEQTASPATRIAYNYVENACMGIVTDNIRLDTPIENNYLFDNGYGIGEGGPDLTDIVNNVALGNDASSIDVYMGPGDGSGDANSFILIQNNTLDWYQDCGITIRGVDDANDAGQVVLVNNIVTRAVYCGLNFIDGYLMGIVSNTGYGENAMNKNWDFEEYDPVEVNDNPYVVGPELLEVSYLRQDCAFIDAGLGYIEETSLIGRTTDYNCAPDSNMTDLGFHHPNWNFSNAGTSGLTADFDWSGEVGNTDLAVIAELWLTDYDRLYESYLRDVDNDGIVGLGDLSYLVQNYPEFYNLFTFAWFAQEWNNEWDERLFDSRADITGDGKVNLQDFSTFAEQWKKQGKTEPNIAIEVDNNSAEGYVDVWVSGGYTPDTERVFIALDGEFVGEIFNFEDGQSIRVNTAHYMNDPNVIHEFKAYSVDPNGKVTLSNKRLETFSGTISSLTAGNFYDSNEAYSFAGFAGEDITLEISDINHTVIFSETAPSGPLNVSIPAGLFDPFEIYYMDFYEDDGGDGAGSKIYSQVLSEQFNIEKLPQNLKGLIVSPDAKLTEYKKEAIEKWQKAFRRRGIKSYTLLLNAATYENIESCISKRPIKYILFICHGKYEVGRWPYFKKLRTIIALADGPIPSLTVSAFNDPNYAPPWCEPIGERLETPRCIWTMTKDTKPNQLKIVYVDACYSGRLKITGDNQLIEGEDGSEGLADFSYSDMSGAFRIVATDQVYIGWQKECYGEDIFFLYYKSWLGYFADALGDAKTIEEAYMYCIEKVKNPLGSQSPGLNFRARGYTSDISSIRLRD